MHTYLHFNIFLKHIVFGYKIFEKDYFDFNYFLAILGFSIYKAYYVSEQKTKQVNIYSLLTVIAGNFFRLIHHLPSTFSIKISGRMYEF
jgi:hypothetical protein